MSNVEIIRSFWQTIDKQEWNKLKDFFTDSATIIWPNTNELFDDINNFVRANSEYPGDWTIDVERIEEVNDTIITASRVSLKGQEVSFYAVSFFELYNGKITRLTEYWGNNEEAPEWRKKLNLSTSLKKS